MMDNFPLPRASEHALRYAKRSGCKGELLSVLQDDGTECTESLDWGQQNTMLRPLVLSQTAWD